MNAQGYDADLAEVRSRLAAKVPEIVPVPGWRTVSLDRDLGAVTIPDGVELDLGASAKAWAADWIAESCTEELRVGCLVNLRGDIAVRGEVPEGGWQVEIDRPGPKGRPVIAMSWPGGLAGSAG